MPNTSLEAVDWLRFADLLSERLGVAQAELGKKRGLAREKEWLATAAATLDEARAQAAGLLDKARHLPELAVLRDEFASALQGAWVDGLEKLLAGITFHVSGRSPIIEALFPHQKLASLRKAPREAVQKFARDFDKRLRSTYSSRILAGEDFAFAQPVLQALKAAWEDYESCFNGDGLPEDQVAPVREALLGAASKIEVAARQAKLLAEAALVPVEGVFEQTGLGLKMKKRTARAAAAPAPEPSADEAAAQEAEAAAEAVEEAAEISHAEGPAPAPKQGRARKAKRAAPEEGASA